MALSVKRVKPTEHRCTACQNLKEGAGALFEIHLRAPDRIQQIYLCEACVADMFTQCANAKHLKGKRVLSADYTHRMYMLDTNCKGDDSVFSSGESAMIILSLEKQTVKGGKTMGKENVNDVPWETDDEAMDVELEGIDDEEAIDETSDDEWPDDDDASDDWGDEDNSEESEEVEDSGSDDAWESEDDDGEPDEFADESEEDDSEDADEGWAEESEDATEESANDEWSEDDSDDAEWEDEESGDGVADEADEEESDVSVDVEWEDDDEEIDETSGSEEATDEDWGL